MPLMANYVQLIVLQIKNYFMEFYGIVDKNKMNNIMLSVQTILY